MNFSKILKLFEDIEYDRSKAAKPGAEKAGVVTATLKSHDSGVFTKLAQKVQRISELEEEIKRLKEEVKTSTRQDIATLFTAEDAVNRRVVETVSFTLALAPDPKPTTTYKYASILEKLESQLTPELIKVLEALKEEFKGVTTKEPILKITPKAGAGVHESITEGVMDRLKQHYTNFLNFVKSWGRKYDKKLDDLKKEAASL